jgi:hypothetical protein
MLSLMLSGSHLERTPSIPALYLPSLNSLRHEHSIPAVAALRRIQIKNCQSNIRLTLYAQRLSTPVWMAINLIRNMIVIEIPLNSKAGQTSLTRNTYHLSDAIDFQVVTASIRRRK